MQRIYCENPVLFDSCLEQAEALTVGDKHLYVYFTGAKDPNTGLSWCGDCTRAEPLVNKVLSSLEEGCVFLEIPVLRDDYRQPDFQLRVDPRVQLRCVPTLLKWVRGKALGRLDDRQCQIEEMITELVDT